MSDDRLRLINKLIVVRGKIYDSEGESEDYHTLSQAIEEVKAKEGVCVALDRP